jgi:hypothetical protein
MTETYTVVSQAKDWEWWKHLDDMFSHMGAEGFESREEAERRAEALRASGLDADVVASSEIE